MLDVGCPKPAVVVDIIERMVNRCVFCLMASMVAADGAVDLVAVVPQQTGDNACDQSQKPDDGTVPANGTCAQGLWHEIAGKCFSDRPKYSLKQSLEHEHNSNICHASST